MRTMTLKETFKILSKSNPEFIQNIITIKENSGNFRNPVTVEVPWTRTTRYVKESFSYGAAKLCNLSNHARSLSTFGQFKMFICNWYFSENCTCSSCKL
jgi:hypothetical protein